MMMMIAFRVVALLLSLKLTKGGFVHGQKLFLSYFFRYK